MKLQDRDYIEAAFQLGCDPEAVKAVCAVEAPRGGFDANGRPVILFEGHIFHRYTKGKFDLSHPMLSHAKWTRANYGSSQDAEHARLAAATALDREAALMSASWGRFQIMGFNYTQCGFARLQDFINAMFASEKAQLDAFVEYLGNTYLDDELREHRWADFARKYNGPLYWKNQYDKKLEAAYVKLKGA
jgi:hypothetical protein